MRELAFAGLTDDGALLLTTGDGQQYALPVDERLAAAVRGDRPRLGQLSIALEGASPRDIQTRVRHGQSAVEVAEQTGLPIDRVERYAGPPLAEREHVAGLARATEVRRPTGDAPLEQLVVASLEAGGADVDSLEWDSWRRDDSRWTLRLLWDGGEGELARGEAVWSYDPGARATAPEDDLAGLLQGQAAEPAAAPDPRRIHLVVADDPAVDLDEPVAPWADARTEGDWVGDGWGDDEDPDASLTAVVDRYSGDVVDLAAGPPRQPGDSPLDDMLETSPGLVRAHAKTSRRDRRKAARTPGTDEAVRPDKARAVVPSWDEILFGTRPPDED